MKSSKSTANPMPTLIKNEDENGVLQIDVYNATKIQILMADQYTCGPHGENGHIRSLLITMADGHLVNLNLISEEHIPLELDTKMDIEAVVGEARGAPLPTMAQVAEGIAKLMSGEETTERLVPSKNKPTLN